MKTITCVSIVAAILLSCGVAAEPVSLEQFLGKKTDVDVQERVTSHQYYIIVSDEEMPERLLEAIQLESSLTRHQRNTAIIALGAILGGDPEAIEFDRFAKAIEAFEAVKGLDSMNHLEYLTRLYTAAAWMGTAESLEFLKARAGLEFWKDREMPKATAILTDPTMEVPKTAQGEALGALAKHPSPEAEKYLQSLLKDPSYADDELLRQQIDSGLQYRSSSLRQAEDRRKAQDIKERLRKGNGTSGKRQEE